MFQKEKDQEQESLCGIKYPCSLGVMKKKGCYHPILENYITTG